MPIAIDPKVTRDLRKIARRYKNFGRQIPFIMSKTINDTLFDVRHHTVKTVFPRSFEVRNKRFAGAAMRVERSTKRKLYGRVFDRLGKDLLLRQAKGGTKHGKTGRLAVPIEAKKTGRGTKPTRSFAKSFLMPLPSGDKAIMQKFGRGGKKLRMLFILKKSVPIPKRFPFYREAKRKANQVYQNNFSAAFKMAARTARV